MRVRLGFLAFSLFFAVAATAQQAPSEEKGFRPEKMYDFGSLDQVNTQNGNLTVTIPIGMRFPLDGGLTYGLSLSYNSKVWDFDEYGDFYLQASPGKRANAGMGWLLTMGRLVPPEDPTNPTEDWIYESPDGADHSFHAVLHAGASGCTGSYCGAGATLYTWDGSFLRMRRKSSTLRAVESGDGTTSEFELVSGKWRLKRIYNAFMDGSGNPLNYVNVTYFPNATTQCPSANSVWQLNDSKGRQHWVCFKNQNVGGDSTPMVDRVVLAGVGENAIYRFEYDLNQSIVKSCHDTVPAQDNPPSTFQVPVLRRVKLPDGASVSCTEDDCSRFQFDSFVTSCPSGALQALTLPTLGKITYDYSTTHIQPLEPCARRGSSSLGVSTRTFSNATGATLGTWTYDAHNVEKGAANYQSYDVCITALGEEHHPVIHDEAIGTVTDPSGNKVIQHYSVWPGNPGAEYDETSPDGFRSIDYSLAIGKYDAAMNANLSSEVWACLGSCAKVRESYVHYRLETEARLGLTSIERERTVYYDDPVGAQQTPRYAHAEYSDYDGFGHYRTTVTSGTFEGDNARTSTSNFNHGANEIGNIGGNLAFSTDDPWVLGTYDTTTVADATGSFTAKYCFDRTTGFLRASRTGTQSSTKDLVTLLTAETAGGASTGNVASEKFYGGDTTPLTSSGTALCTMANGTGLGTLGYQIDHTYSNGVRKTSKYHGMPFFFLDRDLHATGVTLKTRDTNSSLETSYGYDRGGRRTSVQPPGQAATSYVYTKASVAGSAFTPARVTSTATSATAGTVEREYQFDALGRFWREKGRMPDGSSNPPWSFREMLYDALNQKTAVSEFETLTIPSGGTEFTAVPSHKTLFSNYDAFGRARVITAPDAKQTTFSFKGVSGVTRTSKIAMGGVSDASVSTTETYDRQGRLIRVDEPSPNGTIATSYGYDMGDRLTSVNMTDGTSAQQRLFQYDARGLMKQQQHPELGISGNGTTVYGTGSVPAFNGSYDARGHATRRVTGSTDLTTVFDAAERVIEVKRTGGNSLKLFQYDDSDLSPSDCTTLCGKLFATARFNDAPGLGTVTVTEAYQYGGIGGRVSARDQVIGTTALEWEHFSHAQTYNDLGEVQSVTYPCRVPACDRTAPTMSFGYTKGVLTSVGALASSITYQANGAIDVVTHAGGVKEKWTPDPDGMARPAKIQALNAANAELWSSGDYKYDGSGNIKQIGETMFTYDRQSRLTQWTKTFGSGSASTVRGYDALGNFVSSMERACLAGRCNSTGIQAYPVSGLTNHYADLTYDDLGNVTHESGRVFTYDPLGVMTGVNVGGRSFRYLYAADDERIGIVETGVGSGNRITWTLRGFDDQLLSTWSDDATSGTRIRAWKEDQFWRGGSLLASTNSSGTKHYSLDHLGSPRYVTNAGGAFIGTQSFEPFGGGGTVDGGPNQFTGHERDAATVGGGSSDLPDYFHQRYFDLRLGRFLSLDPASESVVLSRPSSWNRYAYALNNPVTNVDPDGRCTMTTSSGAVHTDDSIICVEVAKPHWSAADLRERGNASVAREMMLFFEALKDWGSLKATFAKGRGGALGVGRNDGQNFVQAQGGYGYGAGLKWDPAGRVPTFREGYYPPRAFLGGSATISISLGPLSFDMPVKTGAIIYVGADGRTGIKGYNSYTPRFTSKWKEGLGLGISALAGGDVALTTDFLP